MQATTIKLENPLLKELVAFKPREQSISAFVREILEKEINKQKMIEAADQYNAFMKTNTEEINSMNEWETADLASPPKESGKK